MKNSADRKLNKQTLHLATPDTIHHFLLQRPELQSVFSLIFFADFTHLLELSSAEEPVGPAIFVCIPYEF